ncbi:MAG: corrinoid protein [Gammaproteobacteria bacterium]|nr:corrinoid protein [Gammaproteobacteria bacterium]
MNQAIFEAISTGDAKQTPKLIQQDLDAGIAANIILTESMIPAMRHIGDLFARNEVYVPQMLIAARAMNAGLALIEPVLADTGHQPLARVCIGTVKGDLHDIGKNIVAMMLKGAGFEVMDLGTDCDAATFQEAVDEGAQAICLSALLTTTLPYMKQVINHFSGNNQVRIIIGGAPVTQAYADEIQADGFGGNAVEAVYAVARSLGIAMR